MATFVSLKYLYITSCGLYLGFMYFLSRIGHPQHEHAIYGIASPLT